MKEKRDRGTLGVTSEGAQFLEEIMETGWFAEERHAFLVAISLAFANDLIKDESEMTGVTTKWNIGTLDPDNRLRLMVYSLAEKRLARPYAHAEARGAAGLEYLKRRLVDDRAELAEVLTGQTGS